jgi:hypothetical protein
MSRDAARRVRLVTREKAMRKLLRLQLDSQHLTEEASVALTNQLLKRGISSGEPANAFRDQESERKEKQSRDPGNLFVALGFGVGRWHFGKADRIHSPDTRIERFRTTVFILLLWVPLIPTGSFPVKKKVGVFSGRIKSPEKAAIGWGTNAEGVACRCPRPSSCDLELKRMCLDDLLCNRGARSLKAPTAPTAPTAPLLYT